MAPKAVLDGDEVVVASSFYAGPGIKDLNFGGRVINVRYDPTSKQ